MSGWQTKYSEHQRAAVIAASDRGIKPLSRIQEMAQDGELSLHGAQIPAFHVPYSTVRQWVRAEQRRRAKNVQTDPETAYQQQRGRLSAVVDIGLAQVETKQKKGETDWELIRQVARAMREVGALPAKGERAIKPGHRDPKTGEMQGGQTKGGLAGTILAAARSTASQDQPVPERPSTHLTHAENGGAGTASDSVQTQQDEGPGSAQHHEETRRSTLLRP